MKKYWDIFTDIFKKHYVDFSGTETKERYTVFIAGSYLIQYILRILALNLPGSGGFISSIALLIFTLAVLLPTVGVVIRRLRGIGSSPWLALLLLIPIVDIILIIYLIFVKK
jgi:uncharacterized membrane protein YhaH (DUF805 family)